MGLRPTRLLRFTLALAVIGYVVYFVIFRKIRENVEKSKDYVDNLEMDHDHSHHNHHMHDMSMRSDDHNHGGEDSECSSMHAMVFHLGVCQDILFPGWTSTNAGQMVGACIAVFIAAALYEGLKCFRDILFRRGMQKNLAPSQMNITKQECGPDSNCSGQKIVKYPMLSLMHLVQTVLHMLQVFLSYLLMLIFMTYNVWLCLALILGTGLGYFLFAWKKQSVVDLNEHCH